MGFGVLFRIMECYLCGSKKNIKRKGHPRDKKLISILECSQCGLVFLDNFDHIDENFYQESKMHNEEFQSNSIKEWLEETEIDDIRRIEQHKSKFKNKKILDFGCGAGGFLKRAKSFANKVKGIELDKKVKKYWEGTIEIDSTLEETINSKDLFDIITLFHVLEHIKDPITLLKNISKSIDRKGEIIIELEYEKTPITVANFVSLAEGTMKNSSKSLGVPYYNGLKFHRVIDNFMIQGGCPNGNGMGDPGYKFQDEFHPELKHDKAGVLSMANSGPNTNGSQFFITHNETPWLDNKHTVFGYVISGQEIVDAIEQDDIIEKITIERIE